MPKDFILTLTGPDRIGIVDRVTGLVLERGGNVEGSRMARLGGEFAILMLVAMPEGRFESLEADLGALAAEGYRWTTTPARPAEPRPAERAPGRGDYERRFRDLEDKMDRLLRELEQMRRPSTPGTRALLSR